MSTFLHKTSYFLIQLNKKFLLRSSKYTKTSYPQYSFSVTQELFIVCTTFYARSIHETGGQQYEQTEQRDKLILSTCTHMKF